MPRTALTDSATPNGQQPMGLAGFGDPVFSDEFAAGSLDLAKWVPWYPDVPFWNTTTPGGHKTNSNEPQGYDASGITFPGSSTMRFTFRQQNVAVPELPYSSGMVSSGGLFSQEYGVFEFRAKLPDITGSWCGLWLFPASNEWDYEIDVAENWGRESWNTKSLHTVHTKGFGGVQSEESQSFNPSVGAAFRTFSCWWEPDRIRMYADGQLVFDRNSTQMRIFDEAMYVQCNLAGVWGDTLAASAPFSMDVDYIRVWENAAGEEVEVTDPPDPPTTLAYLGSQPATLMLGTQPASPQFG